jgi:hypothetical protein
MKNRVRIPDDWEASRQPKDGVFSLTLAAELTFSIAECVGDYMMPSDAGSNPASANAE